MIARVLHSHLILGLALLSACDAEAHDRVLNANPRFAEGSQKAAITKTYTIEGDALLGAFPIRPSAAFARKTGGQVGPIDAVPE